MMIPWMVSVTLTTAVDMILCIILVKESVSFVQHYSTQSITVCHHICRHRELTITFLYKLPCVVEEAFLVPKVKRLAVKL